MSVLPQALFDDLYTAVYKLLDDAKADHRLVKLYKGSHASSQPHPLVTDVGSFFLRDHRGMFGFAAAGVGSAAVVGAASPSQVLDEFDARHRPRVRVRDAFTRLAPAGRRTGESVEDFFAYVTDRRHDLGHYRGGSSGYDDEAKAFAAAHFHGLGLRVRPDEVLIFCGGAKGAFIAACASLMCTRDYDRLHHCGGTLLAPEGYYQSLRLIPAIFGGDITVAPDLCADAVRDWVAATHTQPGRVIYLPLVNNATGQILDRLPRPRHRPRRAGPQPGKLRQPRARHRRRRLRRQLPRRRRHTPADRRRHRTRPR